MRTLTRFKDRYHMHIINSSRFTELALPIMSFQTSYNGTFAPIITPSSGTLIWEVDGVMQTTNTPSYTLTGATVDVNLYLGTVALTDYLTGITLSSLNIVGGLDFSWINILGEVRINSNSELTSFILSSNNNVIPFLNVEDCDLSELDLSVATVSTTIGFSRNYNLTSFTQPKAGSSTSVFYAINCTSLPSLTLTNVSISGHLRVDGCTNMEVLTLATSNGIATVVLLSDTKIITQNFSNLQINGSLTALRNAACTSFLINANSSFTYVAITDHTVLPIIDFNGSTINGIFSLAGASILTSATGFSGTSSYLEFANCLALNNLDLSPVTCTGDLYLTNTTSLTNLIPPTYTTAVNLIRSTGGALNVTSIDLLLSTLNTFFSSNAPIKDMSFQCGGGANESPTDGVLNADLLNLISIFSGASFTFTYVIN